MEGRDFPEERAGRRGDPPYRLIRADVLVFLAQAARSGLRWDTIILDPPGFSNSKRMKSALDLKRDHRDLIGRCLALLETGGTLWFSANPRHFSLDTGSLGAEFPALAVRELQREIMDEDFRGRKLPRCYTFQDTYPAFSRRDSGSEPSPAESP
jgi:23S rRNA G2069 N7-methylase RlmK/C1962 C5-methylase RlmI